MMIDRYGHTSTHRPQRMHLAGNRLSGTAPGGRNRFVFTGLATSPAVAGDVATASVAAAINPETIRRKKSRRVTSLHQKPV